MTELDLMKQMASQLTSDMVKEFRVTIIIGEATKLFKKMITSPYYTITKADEVRDFLANHIMPNDTPIIFEDLSLMTRNVQAYLLKFIEEPPAPLIILASQDNISPVILSRCRNIIKIPSTINPQNLSISEFVSHRLELMDEISACKRQGKSVDSEVQYEYDNPEEFSLKQCPEYYYRVTQIKLSNNDTRALDKYLKLL